MRLHTPLAHGSYMSLNVILNITLQKLSELLLAALDAVDVPWERDTRRFRSNGPYRLLSVVTLHLGFVTAVTA